MKTSSNLSYSPSCSTTRCIFCTTSSPPTFTVVDGKVVKIKSENCDSDTDTFFVKSADSDNDSVIERQIKVIFILRKILRVGEETCIKFLRSWDGQLHPEFWLVMCSSCDRLVKEFYGTLKEVGRLERKLEKIRTGLVALVRNTKRFKGQGAEDDDDDDEGENLVVWEAIREEALQIFGEARVIPNGKVPESLSDAKDETNEPDVDFQGGDDDDEDVGFAMSSSSSSEWEPGNSDSDEGLEKCNKKNKTLIVRKRKQKCALRSSGGHPTTSSKPQKPTDSVDSGRELHSQGTDLYTVFMKGRRKYFKCRRCPMAIIELSGLKTHFQIHDDGTGIHCKDCGWFVDPKEMTVHRSRYHKQLYYFKCPDCGYLASNLQRYRKHQELHESGQGEVCNECGWLCMNFPNHIENWHPIGNKNLMMDKMKNRIIKEVTEFQVAAALQQKKEVAMDPLQDTFETFTRDDGQNKYFKCKLCPANYNTLVAIRNHAKVHESGNITVNCEQCGWTVLPNKLLHHIGRHHPKTSSSSVKKCYRFKCNDCTAYYSSTTELEEHKKLHEHGKGKICDECGWLVFRLGSHKVQRHPKGSKGIIVSGNKPEVVFSEEIPYYCDHCHMVYSKVSTLLLHFRTAHASEVGLLSCDSCQSLFETKQLLKLHRKREHGENDYGMEELNTMLEIQKCQYCSEEYDTKSKMDLHIAKKHQDALLTCTICNLTFNGYPYYRRHMETTKAHGNQTKLTCEFCAKVYNSEEQFQNHRRKMHHEELGLEPVKCPECGKILIDKRGLREHIKARHVKEKKFTCEICGKGAISKKRLTAHIAHMHKNKKTKEKKTKLHDLQEDKIQDTNI